MNDEASHDDAAAGGLHAEVIDLVDAFFRGDVTVARLYAQLLAINAESQGLIPIAKAARDVRDRLSLGPEDDYPGLGQALTHLIALVNPDAA